MARPFEEIKKYTAEIYGALSDNEAIALYNYASKLTEESHVVEIGSYAGKSTSIFGMLAADIGFDFVCIDCFITGTPLTKPGKETKELFLKNMKWCGAKFSLWEMKSEEAAPLYKHEIDLLFVDGDHSSPGIDFDCKLWVPKVKINGFILFHDYKSSWTDVAKAVDKLTDLTTVELIDSIIVKKKIK